MFGSSGTVANGAPPPSTPTSSTPVSNRRDVPPSPDTGTGIRGSKTLMRLNKALDERDKNQEIVYSKLCT